MTSILEIKTQSDNIRKLIYKLQDTLRGTQLVSHFRENPLHTQFILDATKEYQSSHLVLDGLKEALGSSILPARESLLTKQNDWLEEGDLIAGWAPGLTESENSPHPSIRVIEEVTEAGYKWRFLDEEETISRNPVIYDSFFQHPGWIKLGISLEGTLKEVIADIYELQEFEIEGLLDQLNYFESKSFLDNEEVAAK